MEGWSPRPSDLTTSSSASSQLLSYSPWQNPLGRKPWVGKCGAWSRRPPRKDRCDRDGGSLHVCWSSSTTPGWFLGRRNPSSWRARPCRLLNPARFLLPGSLPIDRQGIPRPPSSSRPPRSALSKLSRTPRLRGPRGRTPRHRGALPSSSSISSVVGRVALRVVWIPVGSRTFPVQRLVWVVQCSVKSLVISPCTISASRAVWILSLLLFLFSFSRLLRTAPWIPRRRSLWTAGPKGWLPLTLFPCRFCLFLFWLASLALCSGGRRRLLLWLLTGRLVGAAALGLLLDGLLSRRRWRRR